jgi:uncharacterized protein
MTSFYAAGARLFEDWLLLPERIALHVPTATAVVADLHLGYGAARQQLGDAIPARTTVEELQPLAQAAKIHAITSVIVAGDMFERNFDLAVHQSFLDVLDRLGIRFTGLVPGNHDRGADRGGDLLPLFPDGYDLAGWRIAHGDQPIAASRAVMGHWHPALRRQGRKQPCFLVRAQHLILPAFSLDAAGVDVRANPRWRDWHKFVILGNRVMLVDD